MARRDRLRKTPGAKPGELVGSSCLEMRRRARAGRPVPAGLLFAMVAAAGKGVRAFAPIAPTDWPAFGRARSDAGEARGSWPQLSGSWEAGGSWVSEGVCSGRRRRGRREEGGCRGRGGGGGQRTWLATATPDGGVGDAGRGGRTDAGTDTNTPAAAGRAPTPRATEASRDSSVLPRHEQGTGRMRADGSRAASKLADPKRGASGGGEGGGRGGEVKPRMAVFNGVKCGDKSKRGARSARGSQERYIGSEGKGRGKKLAELVMYDFGIEEETSLPAAANKTELSQKVEAELFGEYDATVPGPASSLAAVGAVAVEGGGAQERTGRPLAINLDLLSYHARQRHIKGDYAEARRLYRGCVELDPRDGRGWLGLARQMQKIQKYDKAARLFEAGLENCVDNPYLLQAFAVMEEQRGNQAKALALLNRSVRNHPEHTASWVALGLLNERNRRVGEARGCFETATKNAPRNHYAWLVWGMLEKRIGALDVAREKFKTCLRVNPRNAKVYQAWGVLEAGEDNFALAAELFRAGLEQRSDNTYIMQAWAVMEAKRGDVERATELLKEAIIKRPTDGAVWQAYALLLKNTGDTEGARALFARGAAQAPKHCPTWQAWGILEWQLGRVSEARKLFQEGVWESPKGAFVVRILQARAILEATEGNFEEARKYFGFALARDPYSLPVMVAWALMEESLGEIARARQLFEIAVVTETDNPSVWKVYEQAEARRGFTAEAMAVYERGVTAMMTEDRSSAGWWDKGPSLLDPATGMGSSLLDQASRSLGTSSAEMALRVSRIIGGVQWASDYMSFSALNSSRGADVAFEP